MEQTLALSAYIPQRKGDIDGGVEQMEPYKIYEDEQYVCYDASHLFYSDLRQYVESMVSQRNDVYFDEQVWERVQNIYNYYKENLGTLLGHRDS